VSKRTVYRDVKDLVNSGVPIRGEAGVGYALQRGYELPPLTFSAAEIEALVLGARLVEGWTDPELARAARGALTKIEAVLPKALRELVLKTALYAPRGPWMEARSEGLGILRRGIAGKRKVRFAYERPNGDSSERTVRPLGLYFWGSKWSLAAWCELREDFRNFRPDRMNELTLLDDSWDDADGTTLEGYGEADRARRGDPDPNWKGFR